MKNKILFIIKVMLEIIIAISTFYLCKAYIPILEKITQLYCFVVILVIVLININNIFLILPSKKEDKNIKLFNIYYINYSKVFEICMLINNKIKEKEEIAYKNEHLQKYLVGATSNLTKGIGILTPNITNENSNTKTYEYKELQEIKNTNSTYLSKVINVCKEMNDEVKNGDLVKVDNVKLEIINKEEIAQINSMLSGVFKDNKISTSSDGQVFDININAISDILLKDYKYSLKGKDNTGKEFYINVPIKADKEFENNYSIYDLEIGKVNIIGIYRTKNFIYKSTSTYNYLQELGEEDYVVGDELIKSNTKKQKKQNEDLKSEYSYPYIDLIAIIQDLEIKRDGANE